MACGEDNSISFKVGTKYARDCSGGDDAYLYLVSDDECGWCNSKLDVQGEGSNFVCGTVDEFCLKVNRSRSEDFWTTLSSRNINKPNKDFGDFGAMKFSNELKNLGLRWGDSVLFGMDISHSDVGDKLGFEGDYPDKSGDGSGDSDLGNDDKNDQEHGISVIVCNDSFQCRPYGFCIKGGRYALYQYTKNNNKYFIDRTGVSLFYLGQGLCTYVGGDGKGGKGSEIDSFFSMTGGMFHPSDSDFEIAEGFSFKKGTCSSGFFVVGSDSDSYSSKTEISLLTKSLVSGCNSYNDNRYPVFGYYQDTAGGVRKRLIKYYHSNENLQSQTNIFGVNENICSVYFDYQSVNTKEVWKYINSEKECRFVGGSDTVGFDFVGVNPNYPSILSKSGGECVVSSCGAYDLGSFENVEVCSENNLCKYVKGVGGSSYLCIKDGADYKWVETSSPLEYVCKDGKTYRGTTGTKSCESKSSPFKLPNANGGVTAYSGGETTIWNGTQWVVAKGGLPGAKSGDGYCFCEGGTCTYDGQPSPCDYFTDMDGEYIYYTGSDWEEKGAETDDKHYISDATLCSPESPGSAHVCNEGSACDSYWEGNTYYLCLYSKQGGWVWKDKSQLGAINGLHTTEDNSIVSFSYSSTVDGSTVYTCAMNTTGAFQRNEFSVASNSCRSYNFSGSGTLSSEDGFYPSMSPSDRFTPVYAENLYSCYYSSENGLYCSNDVFLPVGSGGRGGICSVDDNFYECSGKNYCQLVEAYSVNEDGVVETSSFFCGDGGTYGWESARRLNEKLYLEKLLDSGSVICTTDLPSECSEKTGAYCGDSPPSSYLCETDSVWRGPKQFVCENGQWVNGYSPDDYKSQCPLPTGPSSDYWSDAGPFSISGDGRRILLEGKCADEGPQSELTISAESVKLGSDDGLKFGGTCTLNEENCEGRTCDVVCSGSVNGGDVAETVGKAHFTTASFSIDDLDYVDIIGRRMDREGTSLIPRKDFLECTGDFDAASAAPCSTYLEGVTIDGTCYDGYKIAPGDSVTITHSTPSGERTYEYQCVQSGGSYKFFQKPHLTAELSRDLSTTGMIGGDAGKLTYVPSFSSGEVSYSFTYIPNDDMLPAGIDWSDYTISCSLKYGGGSLSASSEDLTCPMGRCDTYTEALDFGSVPVSGFNGDNRITMECDVSGPASNQDSTLTPWRYTFNFDIDDGGVTCDSNDDCFSGICARVGGASTGYCAPVDTVSERESEWSEPETYQGGRPSGYDFYNAICSALGGTFVKDIDLSRGYYVQNALGRVVYWLPSNSDYTARISCSTGGDRLECSLDEGRYVEVDNPTDNTEISVIRLSGRGATFEWQLSRNILSGAVEISPILPQGYSACGDGLDVCDGEGRMLVNFENVSVEGGLKVFIADALNGLCLGNSDREVASCDDRNVGAAFGGVDDFVELINITRYAWPGEGGSNYTFFIDGSGRYSLVHCYENDGSWGCRLYRSPSGDGTSDVALGGTPLYRSSDWSSFTYASDTSINFESSESIPASLVIFTDGEGNLRKYYNFIFPVGYSDVVSKQVEIECGVACSVKRVFPRDTIREQVETSASNYVLKGLTGDVWECGVDAGKYVWKPRLAYSLNSVSITSTAAPPYDSLKVSLVLNEPDSFPETDGVSYDVEGVSCDFFSTALRPVTGEGPGSGTLSFENEDISRSGVVRWCKENSVGLSCLLSGGCDLSLKVVDSETSADVALPDSVSFTIPYIDYSPSEYLQIPCYNSSQCLGSCSIDYYYDDGAYYFSYFGDGTGDGLFRQYMGHCVGVQQSSLSRKCYAGDYSGDILVWDGTDFTYPEDPLPSRLLCDGKDAESEGCTRSCEYTCAWDVNYSKIYFGNAPRDLDENFDYAAYSGCDNIISGESYSNCRDCCEAPELGKVAIGLPGCTVSDYAARLKSDELPDYCGIKKLSAYGDEFALNRTCFSSCGSSDACEGERAGGEECTEWCEPRSELSPGIIIRGPQSGEMEPCNAYPVCIDLPFDPHCDGGECLVNFAPNSYPLVAGSEVYGNGLGTGFKPLPFTSRDVTYVEEDGVWSVCTSRGRQLYLVPSKNISLETGGNNVLRIASFDLYSEGLPSVPSERYRWNVGTTYSLPDWQDSGECSVGKFCHGYNDCQDVPPSEGDTTNDAPFCENVRCIDPDAVGVFFGTVFNDSRTSFDRAETWNMCQLGDCTFDLEGCSASFIGLNLTYLQEGGSLSGVDTVTFGIGAEDFRYRLDSTGKNTYLVDAANLGPFVFPAADSLSGVKYIIVTVNDTLAREFTSIVGVRVPQGSCSSLNADGVEGWFSPAEDRVVDTDVEPSACRVLSDCATGELPNPSARNGRGEVSWCFDVPASLRIDLNDYGSSSDYVYSGLCINTCGSNADGDGYACDFSYGEDPTNCQDCCTEFNTGYEQSQDDGSIVQGVTCYSQCGAPSLCDGIEVGEFTPDGTLLCGIKGGVCDTVSEATEIDGISFLPEGEFTGECTQTGADYVCDVEFNESEEYGVVFRLDGGMWNQLAGLPPAFNYLRNVTITYPDGVSKTFPEGGDGGYSYRVSFPPSFKASYGEQTFVYEVRQNNRLPVKVTIRARIVHRGSTSISNDLQGGCVYRRGTGSSCEENGAALGVLFGSPGVSLEQGPETLNLVCSYGRKQESIVLETSEGCGYYCASGRLPLDVSGMEPGKYSVTCRVEDDFFESATGSATFKVFGKISSVKASLPQEISPGNAYSLFISSVLDEFGNAIPLYTHSWELEQDDLTIQFGATGSVSIPYSVEEGNADFLLTVSKPFYDASTLRFPVFVKIPQQISVTASPGVLYVPLKKAFPGQFASVRLAMSNSGPALNVTVVPIAPEGVDVNITEDELYIGGFSSVSLPVFITVPDSSSDREYSVTFKVYASGKLQDTSTLRIVQTSRPFYDYLLTAKDTGLSELQLFLVGDEVEGELSLRNAGNQKDSYLISSSDSSLSVRPDSASLEGGAEQIIRVVTSKEGDFRVCATSVRLLDRAQDKCVDISVTKKDPTPSISILNSNLTVGRDGTAALSVNLTAGEVSGDYVVEFEASGLSIPPITQSMKESSSLLLTASFPASKKGTYTVTARAYLKDFPDRYSTSSRQIFINVPPSAAVSALLRNIERNDEYLKGELLDDYQLAVSLVQQGDYEAAQEKLESVLSKINRAKNIEQAKVIARGASLKRSYTLAALGGILIVGGIFLYLKPF